MYFASHLFAVLSGKLDPGLSWSRRNGYRRPGSRQARMYQLAISIWNKQPCRWLIAVVFSAFVGIAAGHTVIGFSGSVSVVDGISMAPTYQPDARVFTGPISTPIQRSDIVLVHDGSSSSALKRVVGLPGETVKLWR